MRGALLLVLATVLFAARTGSAQEYDLDFSELEKKPYTLGGFAELEPILFGLDPGSAFYELRLSGRGVDRTFAQYSLGGRLEGSYERGLFSVSGRMEAFLVHGLEGWNESIELLEGYLSFEPGVNVSLDIGKTSNKWGTGYFRSPVSFADRPKDPEDPNEALEGYYAIRAELVKSFEGPLEALSLIPVLLPVTEKVNSGFGDTGHLNLATRLYLLLWDTDIELVFFTGGSRPTSYGLDFSRNLASSFELHGEVAWFEDFERRAPTPSGGLEVEPRRVAATLVGLRYLTPWLTTLIVEHYHDGRGLRKGEASSFFDEVHRAARGDDPAGPGLDDLDRLAHQSFAASLPMRDYLYVRLSQREPFGIVYLTPGLSSIANLGDGSVQVMPEVQYSPATNLVLRLRAAFLVGDRGTDFGEKRNDYRIELRARLFF
jgi:hypothetical protein